MSSLAPLHDYVQPLAGYRFNTDALRLARFASQGIAPPRRIIDLGAGCGVVGFELATHFAQAELLLVERDPALARAARSNAARLGMSRRCRVVQGDLRRHELWLADDLKRTLVVCNPPYYRVGSGRLNRLPQIAGARHELTLTLDAMLEALSAALVRGATACFIHHADRAAEIKRALPARGMQAARWQLVGAASARRVMVQACAEATEATGRRIQVQ